jgi:hypothetical protein
MQVLTDPKRGGSNMPTIDGDVTITVPSGAAGKVIARAEAITVAEGGWRLRDGSQTSDARRALTDALVAIAEDGSLDTIEAQPMLAEEEIRATITAGVAAGLIEWAGLERSDDGRGWRTRDGIESPDPASAVRDAVLAIARSLGHDDRHPPRPIPSDA